MKNVIKRIASLLMVATIALLPVTFVNAAEVEESKGASSTVPIVEIENYSVDGGMLVAGKEVSVNFTLRNTSDSLAVSDCLMTISSNSGMAYPVYGDDNQVYVGSIGAGKTKVVTVDISISSMFAADALDLTANFNYRTSGTGLNNSATIVIPSSGANAVGVKSIEVANHAVVGGKSLINLNYINRGAKDITDAKLLISGNVAKGYEEVNLATIYSGKEYLKDYYVCFSEAGNQEINVVLSYTDGNGESVKNDLGSFTVTVSKDATVDKETKLEFARTKTLVGRVVCLFVGVVMLVAVVLYAKRH